MPSLLPPTYLINPISGKVWNDVITRAWVNLTRKCFRQHKYPKRPHIGHNLFLATYFDIFLAIESKISPKMSIFLMLLAPIWEWSKLTFFKPKNIKSSYFEFQKSYIQSATIAYIRSWTCLSLFRTFDVAIPKPVDIEKSYIPQKKALLPIVWKKFWNWMNFCHGRLQTSFSRLSPFSVHFY